MKRKSLLFTVGALAISASAGTVAYVKVPQIAAVGQFVLMMATGDMIWTGSDDNWHVEDATHMMDFRRKVALGTRDYELAVTIDDASEVNVVLTESIEYANVSIVSIRPTDAAMGTNGPLFTLRFGETHIFTAVVKPVSDGAKPPRYKMEFDNSAEFDSLRVNDASGNDWSSVNLSPGPWFIRFSAWDDSTKQYHNPSPTIRFTP